VELYAGFYSKETKTQRVTSQDGIFFKSVGEWANEIQKIAIPAESFKSNFEIHMISLQKLDVQLNVTIFAISFDNST